MATNQKVRGSNPLQRAKNRSDTEGVASVLFLFSRDSNPERVSGAVDLLSLIRQVKSLEFQQVWVFIVFVSHSGTGKKLRFGLYLVFNRAPRQNRNFPVLSFLFSSGFLTLFLTFILQTALSTQFYIPC